MTFQPMLPSHTSQVPPAMFAVPTREPTGCGAPAWLTHTMISAPVFCPSVRAVGSNQMSYAASHCPEPGKLMLTDVWMPAKRESLTRSGRMLPELQFA